MKPNQRRFLIAIAGLLFLFGCNEPKVFVSTGTLVGLEATPGSTTTPQAPSISFGYKRAEVALIPIDKEYKGSSGPGVKPSNVEAGQSSATATARPDGTQPAKQGSASSDYKDAYSVLAVFKMAVNWFGPAKIEQFIATGMAAQTLADKDSKFFEKLSGARSGIASEAKALQDLSKKSEDPCWKAVDGWRREKYPKVPLQDFLNESSEAEKRTQAIKANLDKCPELGKSLTPG